MSGTRMQPGGKIELKVSLADRKIGVGVVCVLGSFAGEEHGVGGTGKVRSWWVL